MAKGKKNFEFESYMESHLHRWKIQCAYLKMFIADEQEIMNNRLPIPEGEKGEKARK